VIRAVDPIASRRPPDTASPGIAVIVPNRNDSRYLARCIRSILDQATPSEELIVVDDASTDNSIAVIEPLIWGHPRARLVVNPVNIGTNRTVNDSLERARSEYVLLLSANDFVLPGIFMRAKACLARSPTAGLWSAMSWLVDEEDRPIRLHPSPIVSLNEAFLPPERCVKLAHRLGNWFTGATLIYHRDTLRAAGGFNPAYGAPADLFTALVVASLRGAAYTPEPFAAIRIHAGSYSSSALNDIAGLETMLEQLRARGPKLSPRLFSGRFFERTASRYHFAAIRASSGGLFPDVAARVAGWKRIALGIVGRLIPASLRTIRLGCAFLILRPFDIWPTLVNRVLGWTIVRLRLYLRGDGPP
jgi:glycosyltransferase involved in cell wall biosynthesis